MATTIKLTRTLWIIPLALVTMEIFSTYILSTSPTEATIGSAISLSTLAYIYCR